MAGFIIYIPFNQTIIHTYTQTLYQIVFCTKHREPTLTKENRRHLFAYMWGVLKKHNCHVYRINGIEDHLHIAINLHPSVALAKLVKTLKLASSKYIKEQNLFEDFRGWQVGYGAFTYSQTEKWALIEYVKNQEEHHQGKSFTDEYMELLKIHGIDFDEKYVL